MPSSPRLLLLAALLCISLSSLSRTAAARTAADDNFKLVLADHPGQLRWTAPGFDVIESSAKPKGYELGIRGRDQSGRVTFLGFLFLVSGEHSLTGAKCRDDSIDPEKKENPTLKILSTSEITRSGALPITVVNYTTADRSGKTLYMVRAFVATGDMCGDLEFYSNSSIKADDADLQKILASYELDASYLPKFTDVLLYAQVLYKAHMYKAAAPVFEMALQKLRENPDSSNLDPKTMRRVVIDQAGMSYGMSGDIPKARAIFDKAIAEDPDYPMYYYNLACADAEEKKLPEARSHLQQAFARKANGIPGEAMPDPTKDDSFTPYRDNKDFWTFVEGLKAR
jgi:hypothetical protein